MQVMFESMGIASMSMDTLLKDSTSRIVMLEGYSGAIASWYTNPHTVIMSSSYLIPLGMNTE